MSWIGAGALTRTKMSTRAKTSASIASKSAGASGIRKQRKHSVPPVSIRNCKRILRSIKDDIRRTDDLEVLANLAKELRETSNRFYKKTAPALLYKQQKGRCALCQERQRNPKNMALDHIAPRAKGGSSSLDNLQLGPSGHHRRRRLGLLGRLSPGQAGLVRCGPSGAKTADLRDHMARGRADRAAAQHPERDPAGQVFRRSLRAAGGGDRRRDRHAPERLDPPLR